MSSASLRVESLRLAVIILHEQFGVDERMWSLAGGGCPVQGHFGENDQHIRVTDWAQTMAFLKWQLDRP